MTSFNQNNRSSGARYRGRGSRRRTSGPREMHKAVCDNCGRNCEVPFKPSGDRPIYCSNCFEREDSGSSKRPSQRGPDRSGFEKRDNTNKQLLEQVSSLNAKLDRILKVIELKVKKKPVIKKTKVKKATKKEVSKEEKIESENTSKKEAKKSSPKT